MMAQKSTFKNKLNKKSSTIEVKTTKASLLRSSFIKKCHFNSQTSSINKSNIQTSTKHQLTNEKEKKIFCKPEIEIEDFEKMVKRKNYNYLDFHHNQSNDLEQARYVCSKPTKIIKKYLSKIPPPKTNWDSKFNSYHHLYLEKEPYFSSKKSNNSKLHISSSFKTTNVNSTLKFSDNSNIHHTNKNFSASTYNSSHSVNSQPQDILMTNNTSYQQPSFPSVQSFFGPDWHKCSHETNSSSSIHNSSTHHSTCYIPSSHQKTSKSTPNQYSSFIYHHTPKNHQQPSFHFSLNTYL